MCKIESVRALIEARASTDEIEMAYERATGKPAPSKKTIRLWRTQAGCGLPRGVPHGLKPAEVSDVLVVQRLVKKYWIPTSGNPLLC